ncbi:MAG: glycosyltransferase family 4 protein [Gemmataceae bacterium]
MRVGFNARLLTTPGLRGWNRYTINLLAELPAHGVQPVLFGPAPIHPDHLARGPGGSFEMCIAPPMRTLQWEHVWLPRQLRDLGIDLFHTPYHYGVPLWAPCPCIITLHDAIDIQFYRPLTPWRTKLRPIWLYDQLRAWQARTSVDSVISVSEHAKADIARRLRISHSRITVTYEAADPHFHAPIAPAQIEQVRQRFGLHRPYFFYVGGWEERKNLPFLVAGFAAAELPHVELCLAGGSPTQRQSLLAQAETLGVRDRLKLCDWVDEADLPALYAGARGYIAPSFYEGFGLQLCEAMATGCPVLASAASCHPEILGTGGDTFSLKDPTELGTQLRRLATDDSHYEELQRRARARSTDFSWARCAAATAAVYHKTLQHRSSTGTRV